jgi:hypothetical protein
MKASFPHDSYCFYLQIQDDNRRSSCKTTEKIYRNPLVFKETLTCGIRTLGGKLIKWAGFLEPKAGGVNNQGAERAEKMA